MVALIRVLHNWPNVYVSEYSIVLSFFISLYLGCYDHALGFKLH
jgi:hypothetical protein